MNLRLEKWTNDDYENLIEYLKEKSDEKFRDFHISLVPDLEKDSFLGVRMPILRKIGKEISHGNILSFLQLSSPKLYEVRMLRGIVTGLVKTENFREFTSLCDNFLSEVDNWAICDCFCAGLKQAEKYKSEFFDYIQKYLNSSEDWPVRVALVIMLDYYLDDEYIDRVLERCDRIKSDFYYVSMAQSWLVATAIVKCREKTMRYLHHNNLDDVTFNKAIQKCIESRRVDDDTKDYLRTIKR